ncbi:hypothetical protein HWV62_12687 [Athelia sp. TMB]|nr:hypothetical protein HWV62_12687 [Athelia sp. TMB]
MHTHPLPGPRPTQTAHTHPPHARPTALAKFSPLAKGALALSVVVTVQETTKVYGRAGVQENTRVVATARHEIVGHNAVSLEESHKRFRGSPSGSSTPAMALAPGHHSPSSGSMLGYFAHHQTPSTHSSASIPKEIYHNHVESDFNPNALAAQELNAHDVVTQLSISTSRCTILIVNHDGHTSELHCSLPLHLLNRRLLTEAQTATFQTHRLLLSGLDLSEAQRDEQELPSYRSHVYDRVANQYMLDAATRRITNPQAEHGAQQQRIAHGPRARKVRQRTHIAEHVPRAVAREYGAPHAEQRHLPVQRCIADRLRTMSSAGARCSAESAAAGETGVLHEDGLDPRAHRGAHEREACGGRGGDMCDLKEDGVHKLNRGATKGQARAAFIAVGWSVRAAREECARLKIETLINALNKYHKERLSSNKKIAARLAAEHQIHMRYVTCWSLQPSTLIRKSESSVKRRRKELGLLGSGPTTRALPHAVKEQMVVDQLNRDPAKRHGVRTIMQKVAFNEHTHLTKKFVSDIMHLHDNDAFATREPTAKRIHRFPKYPIGIHERWSGDGHDKLYKIGFPIWAMVDDATGKWLGAWVVPSNRMGEIVAYLFLCLVEKFEGLPLQASTDCGSETTKLFALMNALRAIFHPDFDLDTLPAHVYLRSVHNISIERSWLRLRLDWGDNVVLFFNKGIEDGLYNPNNARQYELCQWLWPKLLRTDLAEFMEFRNAAPMRKDKQKPGPSGMSRNEAFSIPSNWGGRNCLLPVDVKVIQEIKAAMGGDALLDFVTPEFATRCEEAYNSLGMSRLTLENIWHVFTALYPLIYQ